MAESKLPASWACGRTRALEKNPVWGSAHVLHCYEYVVCVVPLGKVGMDSVHMCFLVSTNHKQ